MTASTPRRRSRATSSSGMTPPATRSIAPDAWIAPTACLIGDVTVESGASVWYNATLRGDMASIRIGPRTSVQDNVVVHTEADGPTVIGMECTVGHGAIVHDSTIGDNV